MQIDLERLEGLVASFEGLRLLVVGDLVVDRYVWGNVDRVSPEAPVPVVEVTAQTEALGGAGNVARNAIALGATACVCGVLGDDPAGRRAFEMLAELGAETGGLVTVADRPTTEKTRVVAQSQQLLRYDIERTKPLSSEAADLLLAAVKRALAGIDYAIIADYGKGVLSGGTAVRVMEQLKTASVPVVVDPKDDLISYGGATVLKPNLREVERLSGAKAGDRESLMAAVEELGRTVSGGSIVVTEGSGGMTVFEASVEGWSATNVPTPKREVYDVQGAGDTVSVAIALSIASGATLLESAVIANAAAGVVVGKVGTATASIQELRDLLPEAVATARGQS
ncbi:PfkB family carbohydrate kinase [Myxococcota bacterium]|nr:PfkB family carbohydrate kinase [Myxococcota bacterium]